MIVGSGLLACAFAENFQQRSDVCIYAAGVSNSSCTNSSEFVRERQRLIAALQTADSVSAFVYFGTCSVEDSEALRTQYVQHKLAMEQLVAKHPNHMILRLPQLAGNSPNPHTLLNFLYARIARSEAFTVWRNAYRNIIDVDDVAVLAGLMIDDRSLRHCTVNLANPNSYSMPEIINKMEQVVGKRAIYETVELGRNYTIDVAKMVSLLPQSMIRFDAHYLIRVLSKYYEKI